MTHDRNDRDFQAELNSSSTSSTSSTSPSADAQSSRGVENAIYTWANGITGLRLLLLAPATYLLAIDVYSGSLVLFWFIAIADVFDGYIARRLRQVSRIGAALDPIVDRASTFILCIGLLWVGVLPLVTATALLLRDTCVIVLAAWSSRHGRLIKVTLVGKFGSLLVLIGLPGLLFHEDAIGGPTWCYVVALCMTTAGIILAYISAAQYIRQMHRIYDHV